MEEEEVKEWAAEKVGDKYSGGTIKIIMKNVFRRKCLSDAEEPTTYVHCIDITLLQQAALCCAAGSAGLQCTQAAQAAIRGYTGGFQQMH